MTAYYNENDPRAAAWLAEVMKDGLIAPGKIDTRSICDVTAGDLRGFAQHHFFAGIGGWSYALRLAGWPDDRAVWTASCPCQPFSAAGKHGGTSDPRHLWPEARRLVTECRPSTVFGEQVASKPGRLWLSGVFADVEALGYAGAGADLCAAGIGAPHIRQRLFWVADADGGQPRDGDLQSGRQHGQQPQDSGVADGMADRDEGKRGRFTDGEGRQRDRQTPGWIEGDGIAEPSCAVVRLADRQRDTGITRRSADQSAEGNGAAQAGSRIQSGRCSDAGGLGDGDNAGLEGRRQRSDQCADQFTPWAASVFIPCLDGKYRRVPANEAAQPEPALFPLAYGFPNRVVALRGAGNAIVPQLAAEFIRTARECVLLT